ncbi:MAG: MMPL family transporter [Myxococcales bacterium]|nr:MMPL family transporter [Myxococcales bacterium]
MNRWFRTFSNQIIHRPATIVIIWGVLLALGLAVLAWKGIGIDTSRQQMVSEDNPTAARYHRFLREFGTPLHLVAIVEGSNPQINRRYADELATELRKNKQFVREVTYRMNFQEFRKFALLFPPVETVERIENTLRNLASMVPDEAPAELTVVGTTGALHRLNDLLARIEEGDTDRLTPLTKVQIGVEEAQRVFVGTFQVLYDALTDPDWTELALIGTAGSQVELTAAGLDAYGYTTTDDGRVLFLFISPASSSEQVTEVIPFVQTVRATARKLLPDGVSVSLTGNPAFIEAETLQIQHDVWVTSVVSGMLVLLILGIAYRSLWSTALTFLPLFVGIILTLAFASLMFDNLNLLSSVFLAILVGLGVDYGIHVLSRFVEAKHRNPTTKEALRDTLKSASPGVVTGGLTTVAAFLAMAFSDFTGMTELAIISATGLAVELVAYLTLLPAVIAIRGAYLERNNKPYPVPAWEFSVTDHARARGSRWILIVSVTITIGLGAMIRPIEFSFDISEFLPDGTEAVTAYNTLRHVDAFSPDFAVMVSNSELEARETTRKLLSRRDLVARVESVATYLPSDQEKKKPLIHEMQTHAQRIPRLVFSANEERDPTEFVAELVRLLSYLEVDLPVTLKMHKQDSLLPAVRESAKVIKSIIHVARTMDPNVLRTRLGNFESRLGDTLEAVQSFLRSKTDVMTIRDLPTAIKELLSKETTDGLRLVLRVFPRGSIADPKFMNEFNSFMRQLDPEVTGLPITFIEFGDLLKRGLVNAAYLAAVIVFVLVWIDFRSTKDTLLAMFPLALGGVWMVGLMNILNIGYNFANLMSLPLILGIGIDSGVHLMHRYRQNTPPGALWRSIGRAVTLSALTTIAGLGSMMVADHRGMQSLGLTLVIGVGCCLLATTVSLPALLAVIEQKSQRRTQDDLSS